MCGFIDAAALEVMKSEKHECVGNGVAVEGKEFDRKRARLYSVRVTTQIFEQGDVSLWERASCRAVRERADEPFD